MHCSPCLAPPLALMAPHALACPQLPPRLRCFPHRPPAQRPGGVSTPSTVSCCSGKVGWGAEGGACLLARLCGVRMWGLWLESASCLRPSCLHCVKLSWVVKGGAVLGFSLLQRRV